MESLKTFTKILAFFCLLVFVYLLTPDNLIFFKKILKYSILISIMVILIIYNNLLGFLENSRGKHIANEVDIHGLKNENTDTHQLYEDLKSLVFDITKSINIKSKSAIYILDPVRQVFKNQTGQKSDFSDIIPTSNLVVMNHIGRNKKLHQKDFPDVWNELFLSTDWRGSECAILSSINMQGSIAGFVISRLEHFTDIAQNEFDILNKIGSFISFGLDNITKLEKTILGEKSKSLILEIISNLDFKSDSQNIFNQFKYLIRTSFSYDRLTISLRVETENRRKLDKGINSIIKLVDGEKDEFFEGVEFPINGSIHGFPVINRRAINTTNWKKTYPSLGRFSFSEETDSSFQAVLGAPVIIKGESRGSIFLERLNNEAYSSNELNDLELIGSILGSALHWRSEYKKIHINATHDGLSGLLNHQTFKERFSDEILRAARFQQKMAIMIFDLDKFKKVNDTFGHQYGDYVIQTVSKIMEDNVRAVDVVARYGGEEFAVILINSDMEMSNIVAKRIVKNIADFNFNVDGIKTRVTISGGMSEYPTHSDNKTDLIELADKAMYETKQKGGNNIFSHKVKSEVDNKKSV